MSTTYAVRGLAAFAEAMSTAWEDGQRTVEGRPDAQEEAVTLITMHSAKGLEWPVVIPVNLMTVRKAPDNAVVDRHTDTLYCEVMGASPDGYDAAYQNEVEELNRERMRLWYVAATRARELLILPRPDMEPSESAWSRVVNLSLADLPAFDVSALGHRHATARTTTGNTETHDAFAQKSKGIANRQTRLSWVAPSRDESAAGPVVRVDDAEIWIEDSEVQSHEPIRATSVQGGRQRGLILHKLMEEVLTGEVDATVAAVTRRARELIVGLGRSPVADPAAGLSEEEMAACVMRTLALPEIKALQPSLLAEFPVYAACPGDQDETVTYGIADAMTITADGQPSTVVDWKSDVQPDRETLEHYRAQVQQYLDATGAKRGLIVFMTSGRVVGVEP